MDTSHGRLPKGWRKSLTANTRMLWAILNKSWRQHPTKQQLYRHLPPITKTIQVRRIRHAGHCRRSRDVLISDVLLWTPSHGRAKTGRPARTYIQQLCADTRCCPEDLLKAMDDREVWRERVRNIRVLIAWNDDDDFSSHRKILSSRERERERERFARYVEAIHWNNLRLMLGFILKM